MAKIFDTTEYAKWKSFRPSEDSRYVGLCLPHVLMRLPYGKNGASVDGFNYEEGVDGTDHSKYLWGNAAYCTGRAPDRRVRPLRLVRGDSRRGRRRPGGRVCRPTTSRRIEGDVALKCPTESPITDRREKELADLGFVPLVHCKETDYAAFFSVQSARRPRCTTRTRPTPMRGCPRSCRTFMAVSRFAHYLKAMMRDKIGSFMSRSDCQDFLNTWIQQYVVGNDDARPTIKAQKPLPRGQHRSGGGSRKARRLSRGGISRSRTSSSTNCRSRCAWSPICRPVRSRVTRGLARGRKRIAGLSKTKT